MSTLFVDRRDIHIEHDSGALVIRDRGERIATVPLAPSPGCSCAAAPSSPPACCQPWASAALAS